MATQRRPRVRWQGDSGEYYRYTAYSPNTRWKDEPGNYIFARQEEDGGWTAIYIGEAGSGETGSLKTRLTRSHEKLPCAREYDFTHIHAHINNGG